MKKKVSVFQNFKLKLTTPVLAGNIKMKGSQCRDKGGAKKVFKKHFIFVPVGKIVAVRMEESGINQGYSRGLNICIFSKFFRNPKCFPDQGVWVANFRNPSMLIYRVLVRMHCFSN